MELHRFIQSSWLLGHHLQLYHDLFHVSGRPSAGPVAEQVLHGTNPGDARQPPGNSSTDNPDILLELHIIYPPHFCILLNSCQDILALFRALLSFNW